MMPFDARHDSSRLVLGRVHIRTGHTKTKAIAEVTSVLPFEVRMRNVWKRLAPIALLWDAQQDLRDHTLPQEIICSGNAGVLTWE